MKNYPRKPPPPTVLADIPAPVSPHHPFIIIMKLPKPMTTIFIPSLFLCTRISVAPHDGWRVRSASLLMIAFFDGSSST
jgi:hypothetical protein